MKLKLDLHPIYNDSRDIETELQRVIDEAVRPHICVDCSHVTMPPCFRSSIIPIPLASRPAASPSLHLDVPVIATGIPSYEKYSKFCTLDDWGGDAWRAQAMGRSYVQRHHMMEHAAGK